MVISPHGAVLVRERYLRAPGLNMQCLLTFLKHQAFLSFHLLGIVCLQQKNKKRMQTIRSLPEQYIEPSKELRDLPVKKQYRNFYYTLFTCCHKTSGLCINVNISSIALWGRGGGSGTPTKLN